jgi:hypothetical protein
MSWQTVSSGDTSYEVAFDDPAPVGDLIWAIVTGQAIDEMTQLPPAGALSVSVAQPAIDINLNADGSFALVARPWQRFPPLAAASYPLTITVAAAGYIPVALSVDVPTWQRHFAANSLAGDIVITIDDASSIDAGFLLLLGPLAQQEMAVVAFAGPGANQVTLRSGLQFPHSLGDPVVPDLYASTSLGLIALRRMPVRISGRTFSRDDSTNLVTPVPNATITVTDFWRTLTATSSANGSMTDPVVGNRSFALACAPGAYGAHAVAATLAPVTVSSLNSDDKVLSDAVPAGATILPVSNRVNLGAGDLLIIDADEGDAAEPIAAQSVTGWGSPAGEGWATLDWPLELPHQAGARVQRLAAPAPGAARALKDSVAASDVTLFVDAVGALAGTGWITLGAAPNEYQQVQSIQALSDANGYFQLPPIHRIAALQLLASAAGKAPVPLLMQPDYTGNDNSISMVFT